MAGESIQQVNRLFGPGTVAALTDGQLLERFATRRGDAAGSAFEGLVARHGPMVHRVCRALLRDPHDVEDAFQATFLVLVRRARSIGERELLGPWLYGVARRVSLKARGLAARRRSREGGLAAEDPPADLAEGPWLDLHPVLHEELDRLPEKYRKPVVLCHMQGLTHAEAAQELAWPVGTVSVRLARARKLLRERLTRRGLATTATLWAAGLASEGASAAVPQALLHSTTAAAIAFVAGRTLAAGAVPAGPLALARKTITIMSLSRIQWIALPLVLCVGLAGGVAGTRAMMGRPSADAPMVNPAPPAADGRQVPGGAGSPFDLRPIAAANVPTQPAPKADPPLVVRRDGVELDPPPGYFDLPAPARKDGVEPPSLIKPGQVLAVEVLEALPGRPITGERVVRPDGTIGLGFYGDLPVAGLDRRQIKVKLIEYLRGFISDEVLGLMRLDRETGRAVAVPPVDSNRVYVDDSLNYDPAGRAQAARAGRPAPGSVLSRIDQLESELGAIRAELAQSGKAGAGTGNLQPPESSPAVSKEGASPPSPRVPTPADPR